MLAASHGLHIKFIHVNLPYQKNFNEISSMTKCGTALFSFSVFKETVSKAP